MNKYNGYDDTTLVEMTLLGDSDAYGELVSRHEKAVIGSAVKITKNEFSAQDACQDAFVSAWMNLSQLREKALFRPWVCAICVRCALKVNERYAAAIPAISLDALDFDIPDAERFDEYDDIHDAISKLSEKIRNVIQLHYFDGYSVSEIAERLSVPVGTVKWRLNEGRKKLREGFEIMEKEFDENETMVKRVLRQVDELKLWDLKKNKNGFENEYKNVLASANELPEGKDKSHAMADILLLGYWWLPGQKNEQILAEIKKHAEQSENEEVMISVIANESDKYSGEEYAKFMLETEIPYTQKHKMKKAEAYCRFWLGHYYFSSNKPDKGFSCYNEVLDLLEPSDVYYANAKSAITAERKRIELKPNKTLLGYTATGEVYRYIDGKLYFISQPGYGDCGMPVFWYASLCDGLIYDPDLKQGDTVVSSDGVSALICESTDATVSTKAGVFEHCTVYSISGNFKTVYCPGVGIVYSEFSDLKVSLVKFTVKGGDGMIPFYPGNRWEYEADYNGDEYDQENVFEVTSYKKGEAVVSAYSVLCMKEDASTFAGIMRYAANRYAEECGNNQWRLVEVRDKMKKAGMLAKTKKEKVWFQTAYDVVDRIFNTDPEFTPDCKEKGLWNFFNFYDAERKDSLVCVSYIITEIKKSIEWKDRVKGAQPFRLLYNLLYIIIQSGTGCVWCDKWTPGYTDTTTIDYYGTPINTAVSVSENECVNTPAGTFENCRHVNLDVTGFEGGLGYFGGRMECWYANGIGLVKYKRPVNDEVENVWELTAYEGEGDGFFPINDGLIRRYEPKDIGDGCRGFVEYTYVADETGTTIFTNACGVQNREEYEKATKESQQKRKPLPI
ncbi:MAG: RNA polymerase sigma factor [Clostridia bacterium]|nr:RNA polymerase sigma factor [Clostridia bacterium]